MQARYIAQIIMEGGQVVARAFARALREEMQGKSGVCYYRFSIFCITPQAGFCVHIYVLVCFGGWGEVGQS